MRAWQWHWQVGAGGVERRRDLQPVPGAQARPPGEAHQGLSARGPLHLGGSDRISWPALIAIAPRTNAMQATQQHLGDSIGPGPRQEIQTSSSSHVAAATVLPFRILCVSFPSRVGYYRRAPVD